MTCGWGLGRGARGREFFSTRSNPAEDPTLIAYRAMLDVPRELVLELAGLLRAERRARGTRKGTRLLTCFRQALLVLVWMRTKGEVEVIGAGFGVPRATAYRYRDEALRVLAAEAPDLHEALQEVAEQGWSHVVVDGKLIRTDRCAETTTSVKGETINAWYSGKHRAPGGNVQAVIRPDGVPIAVSEVAPGHLHDLTVARDTGVIDALNWAAAQLDLPAGDLQAGDLAEPQPGLDREGEHRSVSAVGPGAGGDGIQQGLRLGAGQERHLRLRVLLDGDGVDPGDGVQALGCPVGVEGHDGLDRGQTEVAGGGAVAAFLYEVVEEGDHVGGVEVSQLEL